MKKKILKILFMTVFMICLFAAFSICSNAATYEPDGTTSTQYEFDAGECNRTIVVTCQDESGRLLKRVNVMTKRGEETFFMISIYNYDIVAFSSDQGLWETCKLQGISGGSQLTGDIDVNYYFRTALSKDTMNVTVVMRPFDEITIKEKHYKEYRIGTNGAIRNDVLADSTTKVIHCGDYYSTRVKTYTGWTLNTAYSRGFSGNWSMSWIGDYENIDSTNGCMEWDIVWASWSGGDYPSWTEYNEAEDGALTHIENRVITVTYKYEVDWCEFRFHANGGTGAPTETVAYWYDHEVTIPDTVPTKSGCTFLGWGTYSTDKSPDYQPGEKVKMGTSKTLYAIWSSPATYTIRYHANGGTGVPPAQTKRHDINLVLTRTEPTRARYTFLGWSTSSNAVSPEYLPGDVYTKNVSDILYAVWEKDNYDFSVSDLTVSKSEIFQNETVSIQVRVDNWDRKNAYSDIPVQLYIDGSLMDTEYVDFSAYGLARLTFRVNVGTVTGDRKVEVRINWYSRSYETNSTDNSLTTTMHVKRDDYVLGIETVPANGQYKEGVTVVTSYLISNDSERDLIPGTGADAEFKVYYYNGSQKVIIHSQIWNDVVVPKGETNLVYFKWEVPEGLNGRTVYCECSVNADGSLKEYNLADNTATLTGTIGKMVSSQTPNQGFVSGKPAGYTEIGEPDESAGSASWTVWEYINGKFVLKKYGVKVSSGDPVITPGSTCASAEYINGRWTMKSGYGITVSFSPTVQTMDGCSTPTTDSYTDVQSVYARFPEYKYLTASGEFRTLVYENGEYQFEENADADGNERLHYIPLWYDDGTYVVNVVATEIWTPAGMITAIRNSNTVNISGTVYDDWRQG